MEALNSGYWHASPDSSPAYLSSHTPPLDQLAKDVFIKIRPRAIISSIRHLASWICANTGPLSGLAQGHTAGKTKTSTKVSK